MAPVRLGRNLIDRPSRSVKQQRRSEVRWGFAAVVVLAVVAVAVGALYISPPGQVRITAEFEEAGQIRVGDGVRVAGIPSGTVKKVTLAGDHVTVQMSIDAGTFIGSESSADVKMLTIVGGNFIDITSAGQDALGRSPIPVSQTSIPYSLTETFQIAQPKISKIDATPLRETLVQLNTGFSENPGALRDNLTILSSMVDNINRRQDDFGALLSVAAEYSKELNGNGDVLTAFARNLSSFVSEYADFGSRLNVAIAALAGLVAKLQGVASAYRDDVDPLVRQIDAIGEAFGPALQRYTPMINEGRDLIARLEGSVGPDGSVVIDHSETVLSSDFCVPVAGVGC